MVTALIVSMIVLWLKGKKTDSVSLETVIVD